VSKPRRSFDLESKSSSEAAQASDVAPIAEDGEAVGGTLTVMKQNCLDSWKEIAAYLQREIRTVQRWEKSEGLPVHRHYHQKIGTVFAFKEEIDAWSLSRASLPYKSQGRTRSASVRAGGFAIAAGDFSITNSVVTSKASKKLESSSNWNKGIIPAIIYIDSETLSHEIVSLFAGTRRLAGNGFTSKSIFLLNSVPALRGRARRRAAGD